MKKTSQKPGIGTLPVDDRAEITRLFLKDDVGVEEDFSHAYNLSAEFTKSKSNRSYPAYAAVVVFAVLLAVSTFLLTEGIQRDIDRISVDITDFKDLNLSELLNALRKAERELGSITDKIEFEKSAMQTEIDRIRRESEIELRRIDRRSDISAAERRNLRRNVEADRDRRIAETRKKYEDRIKEHELLAQNARNKMEELKRKTDAEKIENPQALSALTPADTQGLVDEKLAEQRVIYEEKIEAQKKDYDELAEKYERDIEEARRLNENESNRVRDTEELLNTYRKALAYLARTRGEHGYVIDPGAGDTMLLDVNPYISIKRGDQAYILNREDKIAVLVELEPVGNRIRARVIQWMVRGAIHPFDKILLIKN